MKKTDTRIPDRAVTGMDRNLYTAWQAINSGMAGSFSVVILAVFPLVYRDYYFDILNYWSMRSLHFWRRTSIGERYA